MEKELKKKIKKLCDEAGTSAAAERIDELTEQVSREFEKRVESGESELDAYRAILSNTERIQEMLKNLPKTDDEIRAEEERKSRRKFARRVSSITDAMQSALWLCTVIAYFVISFTFGHWHLTWLMFLSASMGSIIIDMLKKYNNGRPIGETISKEFSGLMWLEITKLYFLLSFAIGGKFWAYSWLIFTLGALIESVRGSIKKIRQ